MVQKKRKSKVSSVKRSNQLRTKLMKQGKLKTRRNRAKPKQIYKPVTQPATTQIQDEEESAEEEEEDVLSMIEKDDLPFLQNAVTNRSYSFLNGLNENGKKSRRRKRKLDDEDDLEVLESQYEQTAQQQGANVKKKKYLLPIKTSEGVVVRSEEVALSEDDEVVEKRNEANSKTVLNTEEENKKAAEVSVAELMAQRQSTLLKNKFRIGSLCSGLTENPELKIRNFKPLLEMINVSDPGVGLTVKKLVLVSLLEVFKDLIPAYQIRHHDDSKVKLKKVVKQLHSYENDLLRYYKEYLRKLEKIILMLKKKKGDTRIFKEQEILLAETASKCLCELLTTHPYFNFSKNIVHLLVPFLNNGRASVRETVFSTIRQVFKTDKRGEISLEVVRNINYLVKTKVNIVHCEVLSVCFSLKLKDINLDKQKEEELKRKKESARNFKFLKLSKRERKRKKKFQELEKELLETKAEENKKSKEHFMTEITKLLFTIYFRILKLTPSSKLLNVALEGLAKFAHCLNIEFYQDLINVLSKLVEDENLKYKEKLNCVQTVFTVLYYQGATISIDPIKFYTHFYSNILEITAGKNHCDLPIVLKVTDFILLKRRKHVSLQRLLAFTKRLTALALQVLPNGSLALLSLISQVLKVNSSTDVLLDLDSSSGQGMYYPEMEEPEYCNAGASSLWELLPLQRHYHPTVREHSRNLVREGCKNEESITHKKFSNLTFEQYYEQFDFNEVKFNPPVASPKIFHKMKKKSLFTNEAFKNYIEQCLKDHKMNVTCDF